MDGYKHPYRLDVTDKSGGLLTYVRSDIPSRLLNDFSFDTSIQILPVELNLRKCKWLLLSIYRPPHQDLKYFLTSLSDALSFYSVSYDNLLIVGDFNSTPESAILGGFLDNNGLRCVLHKSTCFKSANGKCIDLILTNKRSSLMFSDTLETGLSDHHLLVHTMLRTRFSKLPPKKILYRCYKNFSDVAFLSELSDNISDNDFTNYGDLERIVSSILDKHAPLKTKYLRANNCPHVTKSLRKAIMIRSRLKNIANITKDPEDWRNYCNQRNLVVKLNRRAKVSYFNSADIKMGGNFWKTCKPFFSDKSITGGDRILLLEGDVLVQDETSIANLFNKYFNTITHNLQYQNLNL
jgi:hypothetical protein